MMASSMPAAATDGLADRFSLYLNCMSARLGVLRDEDRSRGSPSLLHGLGYIAEDGEAEMRRPSLLRIRSTDNFCP